MQLLYLPAEYKHCCSNYNTKQQKSEYIYIYILAPNTNYHQIKITKTKTWKLQTCIDNEVEKVEDLLRGPTVLRHSHLYPNQLNLIITKFSTSIKTDHTRLKKNKSNSGEQIRTQRERERKKET